MKNDYIVVGLLTILFFIELSNQYWMISVNNKLKSMDKNMIEYFEPILPEWEENSEIK